MAASDGAEGGGRAALILGNYRPALAAARELKRLGWHVVLGVEPGSTGAEASRHVDEIWPAPVPGGDAAAYRAALAGFLAARPDVALLLPITEATLNAVAAAREALPARLRVVSPPPHVLAICHDKTRWLEFAAAAGIGGPPFGTAASLPELRRLADSLGYPLVLRPREAGRRIGRRKALMIADAADLGRQLPEWPAGLGPILAQRRFAGERYNIYFGAHEGTLVRELTSLSLRTDRHDGSGQTIEGAVVKPVPSLSAQLARVVQAMAYTGIGCAQFLYDGTLDASCFLEINPRFGASYVFVERAGMELTRLAIALCGPSPPRGAEPRPLRPVRFVWTYGDLSGLLYSLRRGEVGPLAGLRWLGRALRAAFRADVHVTWSADDPRPALNAYAGRLLPFRRRRKAPAAPAARPDAAPPVAAH